MNCEAFMRELDDWLDGEAAAGTVRELEAHAAGCAACARRLNSARRLQQAAFALPGSIEPGRDLWPGIAERLAPRGRRTLRPWWQALAAGFALAVVFAAGMLADRVLHDDDNGVRTVARDEFALPSVGEARRLLPAAHVELIEGGGELTPGAGVRGGTGQELLRNLLVVNLAIREVEAAVADDPGNADLRQLLAGLYEQENRILNQAERLRAARQSTTRTGI